MITTFAHAFDSISKSSVSLLLRLVVLQHCLWLRALQPMRLQTRQKLCALEPNCASVPKVRQAARDEWFGDGVSVLFFLLRGYQ